MAFGRPDKRDILRGVYEDNLRMSGHRVPETQQPRRTAWGRRLMLPLVAFVLVLGGLVYARDHGPADAAPERSQVAAPAAPPVTPAAAPSTLPVAELPDAASYDALVEETNVPIADLFGLEVHTIVIDPGHGGRDPGAVAVNGLYEKDVVMDVARRLKRRLDAYGSYRILLTRDGDVKVPLKQRVVFANEHDADLFVSLHVNDLPVDSVAMVETYYFGPHSDATALRSARRENQDSQYSIAEFRDVIENLAGRVRLQESRSLAVATQGRLFSSLQTVEPHLQNWGIKTAPFVVLLGVEAPAILTEISVVSNPEEAGRLRTDVHRDRLAAALERGILDYLNARLAENEPAANQPAAIASTYGQETD